MIKPTLDPDIVFLQMKRGFLRGFLLYLYAGMACAQNTPSKASETGHETSMESETTNRVCVVPSLMEYSSNNAFYCTGIPITPNTLTYSGTAATFLTISPDLPSGLTFNTTNGTISGTPIQNAAGNYIVILHNGCGSTLRTIYIAVSSGTNFYSDTDGDSFGSGTATVSCSGQPAGTSTNNTDCAPNDANRWRSASLYVDQDGDGYNNGFPRVSYCYGAVLPTGYTLVNIGTDCDDTNSKINPNAVEIPNNLKDDNCDGVIDEVTTTTSLIASSCGVMIPTLSTTLFAQAVTGAQGYRFEVTNGANVGVYETTLNRFNLLNLSPGVTYSTTSTTNTVRVAVKTGGFWRPFGSPCIVSTPAVQSSTSISNPACGSFLSDIWNTIFCYSIPNATAYRFRVRNGATLIGTYDSPVNRFSFANIPIANLTFGVGYTIDVLLQINGVWMPDTDYGTSCLIITPPTPAASRVTSPSCGSSTNNLWTNIFAVPVTGAQGYKFVLNNGIQYREIVTSGTSISIQNIPGGPVPGTTYTIRIDVLYNNSYVQGRELCTLTILPTATRKSNTDMDIFVTKAFPNPFNDNFKIDINSSAEDNVGIKVYDVLGREVESLQASVNAMAGLEIGSHYSSGVYSVVLTQGEHTKMLRVIKR